jgi:hypothetical protein
MYGLRDIFDLSKLISRYFKTKFEPGLAHITSGGWKVLVT